MRITPDLKQQVLFFRTLPVSPGFIFHNVNLQVGLGFVFGF